MESAQRPATAALIRPAVGLLLALGLLAGAAGRDAAPEAREPAAHPGSEAGAWVSKRVTLQYRGITSHYSCDGLRDRMRELLLKLGARADLRVQGFGCARSNGAPEINPGLVIRMDVLQPTGTRDGGHESGRAAGSSVPAAWQTVRLPPEPDALWRAGDCELIDQIRREILPLFTVRNIEGSTRCQPRAAVPGSTGLTVQVLAPVQVEATSAAR